jgi:integral membrane protein (TIGR01906 family)
VIVSPRSWLAALVIGSSVAIVLAALAVMPFLTPVWMGIGQAHARATEWTGYTDGQLRSVTDAIVHDLVFGPPDFAAPLPGGTTPVLSDAERAHMRDVRGVFAGFCLVALGAAGVLAGAFALARTRGARARLWRRLARSGTVVAIVTVVGGGLGVLVFDQAFTLFHEVFFPGGNWAFDPRKDKLVQIFPDQFWSDTTIAVGITIVLLALGLRWLGGRRAARLERVGGEAAPA